MWVFGFSRLEPCFPFRGPKDIGKVFFWIAVSLPSHHSFFTRPLPHNRGLDEEVLLPRCPGVRSPDMAMVFSSALVFFPPTHPGLDDDAPVTNRLKPF